MIMNRYVWDFETSCVEGLDKNNIWGHEPSLSKKVHGQPYVWDDTSKGKEEHQLMTLIRLGLYEVGILCSLA